MCAIVLDRSGKYPAVHSYAVVLKTVARMGDDGGGSSLDLTNATFTNCENETNPDDCRC